MRARIGAALVAAFTGFLIVSTATNAFTQPPGGKGEKGKGAPGFGPFGGEKRKIVKDFDKNGDGWLNKEERAPARESLKKGGGGFGPGGGFKGGFGKGGDMPPAKPGPKVSPGDVQNYPKADLYDPTVLRTIFLEFENPDWEAELQDFHNTDVEVPATLTVDGKKYPNVGVHFRGMSSYMGVSAGYKRSLNVSIDLADSKQRLYGYKTLNLLNSHDDPSMMSTVLYSHIARKYIPAPKANFVKVVINGESWGVYVNRPAIRQGVPERELQDHQGHAVEGARQSRRGRRAGIHRRQHRRLQAPLRDQVRGRRKGVEGSDQPLQGAEPDPAGQARRSAQADHRHRQPALVPRARRGAHQLRRLLDPVERLQHLPRRQGQVPHRPARHERGVPTRDGAGHGRPWRRRLHPASTAGCHSPSPTARRSATHRGAEEETRGPAERRR